MAAVSWPSRARSADRLSSTRFIRVASGHSRANESSIGTIECFKAWIRVMRILFNPVSSSKNIQRRVLQQHDGLGIDDAAVADHGQRLINRKLQHLDVLAFGGDATAAADPHRGFVG